MFNKQVDSRAGRRRRPPARPSARSCSLAQSTSGRNVVARRDRVLAHQGGDLTPATTIAARRQTLGPAAGLPRAALQSAAARRRDHLRRASPHRREFRAPIAASLFCRSEPPAPKRSAGSPVRSPNASRRFDDRAQTPRRPKPPRRTKSLSANATIRFGRQSIDDSRRAASALRRSRRLWLDRSFALPQQASHRPAPRLRFDKRQRTPPPAVGLGFERRQEMPPLVARQLAVDQSVDQHRIALFVGKVHDL